MGQSSKEERALSKQNSKYKWDNKNVMDYAVEQATEIGRELVQWEVAIQMLADNEPLEKIIRYTKLTISEIEQLLSGSTNHLTK